MFSENQSNPQIDIDAAKHEFIKVLKQEFAKLEPKLIITEIPRTEFENAIKKKATKNINQGDSKVALAGELLISHDYTLCRPVILWDNLNGYALHLHYDNNIDRFSHHQYSSLNFFPKGLLTQIMIESKRTGSQAEAVAKEVAQVRDDVHNIQNIPLPLNENVRFTVALNPESKTIYVGENSPEGKAWKITGFDLDLRNVLGRDTFNKISDPFKVSPQQIFSSLGDE